MSLIYLSEFEFKIHCFFIINTIKAINANNIAITNPTRHLSHCAALTKKLIVFFALFKVDPVSLTLSCIFANC